MGIHADKPDIAGVEQPGPDKTRWSLLWAIIAIAVAVRMVVALLMGDRVVELPGIQDQISYNALALRLLGGHGYSFDAGWYPFTPANTPTAHWSFVYPLYLAGTYLLFGVHPLVARLIQGVVTGVLTCWLVYRLGSRIFGRNVGLVAAGIAAIYTYFIYYSAALMTESFFMITALLTLELTYQLAERPTLGRAALLGLALGIGVLLRQTMLPLIPVILIWLWWQARARLRPWHYVIPLVIVAGCILPWTLRNYAVYGRFLLLNSNAGYAFYSSNHPQLSVNWQPSSSVAPIPPEWLSGNEAEMDQRLMRTGVGFVLADPGRYALLTLSKVKEYYKFWPSPDSTTISNVQRLLSFAPLLFLALYGIYLGRARWRQWSLLMIFVLLVAAMHLLTWPTARYRVPTDACLMPFAALALIQLYTSIMTRLAKPVNGTTLENPVPH